jgi:hypothetical protein
LNCKSIFIFVTLYKVPITFPFFRWCAYIFVCVCVCVCVGMHCRFVDSLVRKWSKGNGLKLEKNIIIMLFTVVTKSPNDAIAINQTISFYSLWKWTDHRLSLRWPVRVVRSSKSSSTCMSSVSSEEWECHIPKSTKKLIFNCSIRPRNVVHFSLHFMVYAFGFVSIRLSWSKSIATEC